MRKYFPVLFFFMTVFAYLTYQTGLEVWTELHAETKLKLSEKKQKNEESKKTAESWFLNYHQVDIEKNKIDLAKVKAPLVLINFWATWCSPCKKEIPTLIELRKKISPDKLFIFSINNDESNALTRVVKVSKEFGINYPIVLDEKNNGVAELSIQDYPATYLFKNGKLITIESGYTNFMSTDFLDLLK